MREFSILTVRPHKIMMASQATSNVSIPNFQSRWFIVASLILWLALDLGYRFYVSVDHSYEGFIYTPNWLKYIEGLVIYLFLLIFSPKLLKRPSDFFQIILLFGLLLPLLIFYGLADQNRRYLYIVLMGYMLVDWFRRGKVVSFPILRQGTMIVTASLLTGVILVSVWLLASGGINYFNLDLTAVYEFREDVGSVVDQGVMKYLNSWAYNVFGPALLAIALWKRHFLLALIVAAAHVYWFGVSSHKAVLFYPFLVFFLWLWFRKTQALSIIPFAIAGVVLASLTLYYIADFGISISTLFIRRTFFVLANNTFDYYEFFSVNEQVYWSNSVLSCCLNYPYHLIPAQLIGEARGTDSHVNNTFLSTGYMHAGIWGIVGYSILCGLIFRLADSLATKGIPVWVALAVLIVPMRSLLLSADLPTSLLTHGIGVGIVVLFLLRSKASRFEQKCLESGK